MRGVFVSLALASLLSFGRPAEACYKNPPADQNPPPPRVFCVGPKVYVEVGVYFRSTETSSCACAVGISLIPGMRVEAVEASVGALDTTSLSFTANNDFDFQRNAATDSAYASGGNAIGFAPMGCAEWFGFSDTSVAPQPGGPPPTGSIWAFCFTFNVNVWLIQGPAFQIQFASGLGDSGGAPIFQTAAAQGDPHWDHYVSYSNTPPSCPEPSTLAAACLAAASGLWIGKRSRRRGV